MPCSATQDCTSSMHWNAGDTRSDPCPGPLKPPLAAPGSPELVAPYTTEEKEGDPGVEANVDSMASALSALLTTELPAVVMVVVVDDAPDTPEDGTVPPLLPGPAVPAPAPAPAPLAPGAA